jgi:2-amino-4-hydroxy-6-hydroxymethyldihydropteridine diphosphokinase
VGEIARYAIALGSNRRSRLGAPPAAIAEALDQLGRIGRVIARSGIMETPPIGPARRRFANAAAVLDCDLAPPALLAVLKGIERGLGRRPGQRWGDRVIDLDIALWSGGRVRSRQLTVPHVGLSQRRFVLDPLSEVAADWRLPGSALRVRHLRARLTRWGRGG